MRKIYCGWDQKDFDFQENSEIDWVTLKEGKIRVHLVIKCPFCGQESGHTYTLEYATSIINQEKRS